MTSGQAAIATLIAIYVLGVGTAFYTAATTWHDESKPRPPLWSYAFLIPPSLIWPPVVVIFAVSAAYQGEKPKTASQ